MLISNDIAATVGGFLWPLFRVLAVFGVAPVLGTRIVPTRVRLGMGLMVTMVIVPILPPVDVGDASVAMLVGILFQQLMVGIAIGLTLRVVFAALQLGAQVIALQMGLGFSELVDPQNGAQTPTLSQFYLIVGTLVFLALNGHHMLIWLLAESFELVPVGLGGIGTEGLLAFVNFAGTLFTGAVMVALPATAAMVCVNIVMGVMTRAVPQFNMFVAFPALLLLGLMTVFVSLPSLTMQLSQMLDAAISTTRFDILGGR